MRVRDRARSWYLLGDAIQSGWVTYLFAKRKFKFKSEGWGSYKQEKTFYWNEAENLTF